MLQSEQEIVEGLRRRCGNAAAVTALAAELGVARSYLVDIVAGRRGLGPAVYKKLGYERVVMYRPAAGETTARIIRQTQGGRDGEKVQ
jgi:hypothetical protein